MSRIGEGRIKCDNCDREIKVSEAVGWTTFSVDGGSVNNWTIFCEASMDLCPDCQKVVKWDPFGKDGSDFIPVEQELTPPPEV